MKDPEFVILALESGNNSANELDALRAQISAHEDQVRELEVERDEARAVARKLVWYTVDHTCGSPVCMACRVFTEKRPHDPNCPALTVDSWPAPDAPRTPNGTCSRCGGPQGTIDTTMFRQQWLMVQPDGAWELCANCIVERASKLPRVITVQAIILFADDFDDMIDHGQGVGCHPRKLSSACPHCTPSTPGANS